MGKPSVPAAEHRFRTLAAVAGFVLVLGGVIHGDIAGVSMAVVGGRLIVFAWMGYRAHNFGTMLLYPPREPPGVPPVPEDPPNAPSGSPADVVELPLAPPAPGCGRG